MNYDYVQGYSSPEFPDRTFASLGALAKHLVYKRLQELFSLAKEGNMDAIANAADKLFFAISDWRHHSKG